jgi:hypothetical protein
MNDAYKKECIHCANYNVESDKCTIHGKCEFIKLTSKKIRYRRKSSDITRDILGNKMDE